MAKWVCFGPLFFNLIRLIQLCDIKNLTFVDCWDKILLNSSWKTLLSSPKARLITLSKTRSIKFISTVNSWQILYIPHEKNVDLAKRKTFADVNLDVTQKMQYLFDRVENIMGKGKILVTNIFSFSHIFFFFLIYFLFWVYYRSHCMVES